MCYTYDIRSYMENGVMCMKNVLHWISAILCIVLAGAGVLLIVYRDRSVEEPSTIFVIFGGVQIAWAFIMFMIGALLPKDPRVISKGMQRFLKVILLLAALGGSGTGNAAAYRLADGDVKLQRFWEPALPLVWLIIEAAIFLFFPGTGILGMAMILSQISLLLIFVCNLGWKVIYCRENDVFRWSIVLLPSIIIVAIFALIFLITFIQDARRGATLNEELTDTRAEIEEALDSYGERSDSDEPLPYEGLDMTGVVDLVRADFAGSTGDIYYRWVGGEDDIYSMVVWSDESDDIYVYQFIKAEGLYDLENAFISDSISKEDVTGNEDGKISLK